MGGLILLFELGNVLGGLRMLWSTTEYVLNSITVGTEHNITV